MAHLAIASEVSMVVCKLFWKLSMDGFAYLDFDAHKYSVLAGVGAWNVVFAFKLRLPNHTQPQEHISVVP